MTIWSAVLLSVRKAVVTVHVWVSRNRSLLDHRLAVRMFSPLADVSDDVAGGYLLVKAGRQI